MTATAIFSDSLDEQGTHFGNVQTDICAPLLTPTPCPALYTPSWNGASRVVIKGPLLSLKENNCAAGYCSVPPSTSTKNKAHTSLSCPLLLLYRLGLSRYCGDG